MGTPIPRKSSEIASSFSGECKVYYLTPEQIAKLEPAKAIPKHHHKPMLFKHKSKSDQS